MLKKQRIVGIDNILGRSKGFLSSYCDSLRGSLCLMTVEGAPLLCVNIYSTGNIKYHNVWQYNERVIQRVAM